MRAHPLEAVRARIADFKAVFAIPAFATYQAGNLIMTTGFWMQRIAVGWVTWELTGSEAWLGTVAFAELFPSLLTALWGGSLADRHAAPRIMYWGQIASAAVSVSLALLYFSGGLTPWAMAGMMAVLGAVSGVLLPARLSMARHLAPPKLLSSALAVNSTGFNLSRFLGPALAAGLLVLGSAGLVFTVSAIGFLALSIALYRIRNVPAQTDRVVSTQPVNMAGVLRDLLHAPLILGVLMLQLAQGLLIRPASELFPAYSEVAFGRGEVGLGLLNAALGIGAILGALLMSKAQDGRAALVQILTTSAVFALSLLVFAVTSVFWLALAVLLLHGATMSSSNIAALAYVQLEAPQDRLGRILSLYTIIFRVGPALGAFLFGITAEATSLMTTGISFALAGLLATGGLALFILKPRDQNHDRS
ncbi:MAG: MFS transporter [Marivita sp.]|uniref:MFS transporter n=1 Tax=Marivita sp. TaxID=2003365 RepID=UPI0025C55CEE|nr:MFS transporter [Marivita sp.]MCI5112821.1 MFS transporter [Marivita sp.]